MIYFSLFEPLDFCPKSLLVACAVKGVSAYALKPSVRGRPNERFLKNTMRGVEFCESWPQSLNFCAFKVVLGKGQSRPEQCLFTRVLVWMYLVL